VLSGELPANVLNPEALTGRRGVTDRAGSGAR
jgi:hypothetical protein